MRLPILAPFLLSPRLALAALASLVLLVWLGVFLYARSTGLPISARIVAVDQRGWSAPARPYTSMRYHLVGRPDYVVSVRGREIPVEAKPTRRGPVRPWDVVQLGAYLLLTEEATHQQPRYGLLVYRDRTYRIRNSRRLQRTVLQALAQVQAARAGQAIERYPLPRARCATCGYRRRCRPGF